jgi:invasion protein IalB
MSTQLRFVVVVIAMKRLLGTAAIAAALALPSGAFAATSQSAQQQHDNMTIQGVVSSIDGKWNLTVQQDSGFIQNVALERGTVIAPTGMRLATGMQITVVGYEDGPYIDAVRIAGPVGAATWHGTAGSGIGSLMPQEIPTGTFQTEGPTAAGGG